MLTPDYLLHISEGAEDIAQVLHTDIVNRIVERITARANRHDDYMFTSLDRWQLQALTDSGIMMEDIIADIAKATNKQSDEIRQAMEDAGIKTVRYDDKIFRAAGLEPNNLSPGVMRIMERNYRATMGEWNNFTRTIADSSQQTFIQAMDRAYILTSSGAVGYTQAFMEAINMAVRDGVTVYYPSGHRDTLETAALRCVRTGISQMSAQVTEKRMDEMGVDLVLVSSHMGARPSHAVWQGKVFSLSGRDRKYPELRSSTGYGTVTGLCGANCRHNFSPYYEGMENPFDHYDSEENKKLYDETQQQRALERRIRRTKREMEGYKTAQDGAEGELAEQAKAQYERKAALLKKQTAEYNEFCKDHDLRPLRDRLQIAKAGRETFVTVPDVKIEPAVPKLETYAKKIASTLDETDRGLFEKQIGRTEPAMRKLYHQHADKVSSVECKAGSGVFYPGTKKVEYGLNESRKATDRGRFATLTHEMGHAFDTILGEVEGLTFEEYEAVLNSRWRYRPSQSDQFLAAMRKDKQALKELLKDADTLADFKKDTNSVGVQDTLDGFFGTQSKGILGWGHGERYYNRQFNGRVKGYREYEVLEYYKERGITKTKTGMKAEVRIFDTASEAWANIASAVTEGGSQLEYVEKHMPHALAEFRRIIGGV